MKTIEKVSKKKQNGITRALLEAISYRTPLPVTKIIIYGYEDAYPVCPRCAMSIEREYMAFCDRCGQKLSWKLFAHTKVVRPGYNRKQL